MKILTAEQIRAADAYTIENEPISSIDLMERASLAFVNSFCEYYDESCAVTIFCGTGNNGGDGLAIGRLLHEKQYEVQAWVVGNEEKASMDFKLNKLRVQYPIKQLEEISEIPKFSENTIIIDAMFGSGLNRSLAGFPAQLVTFLNQSGAEIVAVDIASGLFSEQPMNDTEAIRPTRTISFQVPKLAFFQTELAMYVGNWEILDIGLDEDFIQQQPSFFQLTGSVDIELSIRSPFMHKGDAGRVQLWAGAKGKMGAAILAAKSCLRAGAGLLYMKSPAKGTPILQQTVLEAMVTEDEGETEIISSTYLEIADVIGIGPGIGTAEATQQAVTELLTNHDHQKPMVFDADGLNILASNPHLLEKLPKGSILTPHPGEFKRLVGAWRDDYDKLQKLQALCQKYQLNVVLKGAFSMVCNEQGEVFFNPTGNAGMATAGSGDVLFGLVCGLLAQDKNPFDSLRSAVYIHGLAGDFAKQDLGMRSMMASDLIEYLPEAIQYVES
ncbi:MAG: NAD(P)H-hydrate dehydratase [Cytophagales bacterium]|nr:NAD(P)H-hydrate dehydratase [Cytophagales bacterium]